MIERAAILKHQHDRLAGSCDGLEHLLLDAGQIERGARCGFAAHVGGLAHHRNDNVRIGSGGLGFGEPVRDLGFGGRRLRLLARIIVSNRPGKTRVGAGPRT